jgi:hypothetical protein
MSVSIPISANSRVLLVSFMTALTAVPPLTVKGSFPITAKAFSDADDRNDVRALMIKL